MDKREFRVLPPGFIHDWLQATEGHVRVDTYRDVLPGDWAAYMMPGLVHWHATDLHEDRGRYLVQNVNYGGNIVGGFTDFVTGGWFGETLFWRENPKGQRDKPWPLHPIAKCGHIETARAWDVDGDGQLEIVPNTPGGPLRFYKLQTDADGRPTGRFTEHLVHPERSGHGFGFGDINGDGRGELILATGWLEPPEDPLAGPWTFHPDFDLGHASCPIIVADVNGDGRPDLIVGNAHGYGLWWWEQRPDGWVKHPIDPFNSQYHDMVWADIDGDGLPELITGKRYRAHCGHDPGAYDPPGIYYFKWNGEGFTKQVIDYGPIRQATGCGIAFQVADVDGDGRLDIVAPGKDGLYLFRNLGFASNMGD